MEGISFSGFVKTIDPASIVLSGSDALRRKMLDVAGAVALSILSYHTQRRHDIRLFKRIEASRTEVSPSGGVLRRLAGSQSGGRRGGVL